METPMKNIYKQKTYILTNCVVTLDLPVNIMMMCSGYIYEINCYHQDNMKFLSSSFTITITLRFLKYYFPIILQPPPILSPSYHLKSEDINKSKLKSEEIIGTVAFSDTLSRHVCPGNI